MDPPPLPPHCIRTIRLPVKNRQSNLKITFIDPPWLVSGTGREIEEIGPAQDNFPAVTEENRPGSTQHRHPFARACSAPCSKRVGTAYGQAPSYPSASEN